MPANRRPPPDLRNTGERFIPDVRSGDMLEHVHRYALAREIVAGRSVLDIACGEGYGSWIMSRRAASVTGVDISEDAVNNARSYYKRDNLEFKLGNCSAIPSASGSFDVVVSYETIEHHEEHEEMLAEIKRVLRPDGVLVISTPDRRVYSDEPNYNNPFHVREYYAEEFIELIQDHFSNAAFYGQRRILGSCVAPISRDPAESALAMYDGDVAGLRRSNDLPNPVYLIAVAGNRDDLPQLPVSFYSPTDKAAKAQRLLPHAGSVLAELWRRASRQMRGSRRRPL